MKTLKNNIYKDIISILCSAKKDLNNAPAVVIFDKAISTYPSKSVYCLAAHRLIAYIEQNIRNVDLILDAMRDEGEDKDIIEAIEFLKTNPTISTRAEANRLCSMLSDYIKYAAILKAKDPFLKTLDIIEEDDDNLHDNIEKLYELAMQIAKAYQAVNLQSVIHSFDSSDMEAMKMAIADAKDARSPDKCIITGVRGLNNLLSPGYLSGCLYIYCALPGNYKSGILLKSHVDTLKYNDHIKNTTNGKIPISMYISMENTMAQTIRRLWSVLFPTADMNSFSVDEISEMIKNELEMKGMRSVILYYGYREKSTKDLEAIIRSYNTEDYEVVACYLDYIKRIRSARTDAAVMASEKSELHAIMNELKTIAADLNIPIVSGHQLNRDAARQVDEIVKSGGFNKTDQAMGRSNVGTAWEIHEVADWMAVMNIENNGEVKYLMIKAIKQRDLDNNTDNSVQAIRHPFISVQSFGLKDDIMETVSISIPVYTGVQRINYVAAV